MVCLGKRGDGVQGLTFGVMDGVITCLGVIMGLSAADNRFFLILGVLAVGFADALADAAAFHVGQETEKHHKKKEIRKSTVLTFIGVFSGFLILSVPILAFDLAVGVIGALIFGVILLGGLGRLVACINPKHSANRLMLEYISMGLAVSALTFIVGRLIVGLGA